MALDEAPPFWWEPPGWQAWLLSPVSLIYGKLAARRMNHTPAASVPVPVICVGNFIVGGAGKTPTVELLAKAAEKRGMQPGILSRGHGGAISKATLVEPNRHNAMDVGDEALLHTRHSITVVSTDRPSGAELLVEHGCDIILMDDGFQNPALMKDFNLIVVDAKRGLGNGFAIPAGPMRVSLKDQLLLTDAVLIVGEGDGADTVIRRCSKAAKPTFLARMAPRSKLGSSAYHAYAGIGDPSKFFDLLKNCDASLRETVNFGDHHIFTDEDCNDLLTNAKAADAQLITTAKDAARLKGMGKIQEKLLGASEVFEIEIRADDAHFPEVILDHGIKNAEKRILSRKSPELETEQPQPH